MAASPAAPKDGKAEEKFALTSSRHFSAWLDRVGASLAFTTYQAGEVFFIGRKRECSNVPSPAAWDSASGLMVVATTSGDTVEWARLEGVVRELFDVAVPPGIRNPAAIGFKTDEIQRVISIDEGEAASGY